MLKDALENAARYFLSCQGEACSRAPLTNRAVFGFNYDMAQGVEYEIDLTRPEGSRIRNLRWHGQPLDAGRKLKLAINNYRAAGSAGYGMFRGAKILWHSGDEIRDLMVRFYTERKELPAAPDKNWRILPEAARRTLEAAGAGGSRTPRRQPISGHHETTPVSGTDRSGLLGGGPFRQVGRQHRSEGPLQRHAHPPSRARGVRAEGQDRFGQGGAARGRRFRIHPQRRGGG